MLDPAILFLINNPPMPPEPPQMVQEQMLLSRPAAELERTGARMLASFEQYSASWKLQVLQLKVSLETVGLDLEWNADHLAQLSKTIEDIEAEAERRAIRIDRGEKHNRRSTKKLFALDPSAGAVARSVDARIRAIDVDVLDRMLDFALFLRAFRAERMPSARGGPVFDNEDDLGRYLDRVVA